MNTPCLRKIVLSFVAGLTLVVTGMWSAPAHATVFNFQDMYYISNSSTFTSVFGSVSSGPGYTTSGVYQKTQDAAHGGTLVTRIASATGGIPFEYIENTTPNKNEWLTINGFQATSLINGQAVGTVSNSSINPGFLRDTVNGVTTAFEFDSVYLSGSGTTTLRGELNLNPVPGLTRTITLTSTPTLYTFDWTGLDTVSWYPNGFTSSFQVQMDNIVINDPPTATPEPTTMLLMGVGALGMGFVRRRKAKMAN